MKCTLAASLVAILLISASKPLSGQSAAVLHLSHDATVHIVSQLGNSSGSGFVVGDRLVLTALHVVVRSERDPNSGMVNMKPFMDIQVTLSSGEVIPADIASIPSDADPAPAQYDFAFLRLRRKPSIMATRLQLCDDKELASLDLGDDVAFSGFPLATPGMVTHRGMVSGTNADRSLIFIEAPINKGNSGGALVDKAGKVIGIVSLREGGITQGLAQLRGDINSRSHDGSVLIMGIDPLEANKMLIDTIDEYISVGIGYAINVKFSRTYLEKHPELKR